MNKNYKILIVFFIFFGLLIPTNLVNGSTDISYTFDDNILIDSTISEFDDIFNVKDSEYYTEHYNATYSFIDDDDGSNPTNWTVNEAGGTVNIINSIDGHSKVIEMNDSSNGASIYTRQQFLTTQLEGTIEFWIRSADVSISTSFHVYTVVSGAGDKINIRIESDKIQYFYGAVWNDATNGGVLDNIWYHFSLDFDISTDTYDFRLNNVLLDSNIPFKSVSVVGLNTLQFNTGTVDIVIFYIDAVGYSFNPNEFTFEQFGLYDYFDNYNQTPYRIPEQWTYLNYSDTFGIIENFQDISNQYLRLYDNSGIDDVRITQLWNETVLEGTITMYIRFVQADKDYIIEIGGGIFGFYTLNNQLTFFRFADSTITFFNYSANVWYNFEIYFNLNTDRIQIYIDDNLELDTDISGVGDDTCTSLGFRTEDAHGFPFAYYLDIDEINYDFIGRYKIGNNLLPYLNSTGFMEVDKYEFALQDINTLIPINTKEVLGWEQTGVENELAVIIADPIDSNDRVYKLSTDGLAQTVGILNDDFISTDDFITIDIEFEMMDMNGNNGTHTVILESSDDVYIAMFDFRSNGSMNIFQTIDDPWGLQVRDDITTGKIYRVIVIIDYELDLTFIDFYIDGVHDDSYMVSNFYDGKNGLKKITLLVHSVDYSNLHWNIDNIGVYYNGISQSIELAYSVYNIGQNWNTQNHNLLSLKANGSFDIGIVEGSYSVGMSMTTFRTIRNYFNILHLINGYDSDNYLVNATFVFTLLNHYFNISTFKIDGVLLKEGINEYNLEFEHSGVDIDESYFFVVSNKLQFRHIANDTNLEYIQATFDIDDVNTTDYAFSFRSDMDNNAYGYVRINYTDTSTIIQIPYTLTTTRFLLSQNKIVRDIIILITDKDNNVITGLTTGYIYNVQLIDVLTIGVSIITESLLNMIIPLIIILMPTFLFSQKFGKMIIVPLFILFSLVLTMTFIIPYWLFFIILFPSIIMVFFKSKEEVV